jgi:hypothetical protein
MGEKAQKLFDKLIAAGKLEAMKQGVFTAALGEAGATPNQIALAIHAHEIEAANASVRQAAPPSEPTASPEPATKPRGHKKVEKPKSEATEVVKEAVKKEETPAEKPKDQPTKTGTSPKTTSVGGNVNPNATGLTDEQAATEAAYRAFLRQNNVTEQGGRLGQLLGLDMATMKNPTVAKALNAHAMEFYDKKSGLFTGLDVQALRKAIRVHGAEKALPASLEGGLADLEAAAKPTAGGAGALLSKLGLPAGIAATAEKSEALRTLMTKYPQLAPMIQKAVMAGAPKATGFMAALNSRPVQATLIAPWLLGLLGKGVAGSVGQRAPLRALQEFVAAKGAAPQGMGGIGGALGIAENPTSYAPNMGGLVQSGESRGLENINSILAQKLGTQLPLQMSAGNSAILSALSPQANLTENEALIGGAR